MNILKKIFRKRKIFSLLVLPLLATGVWVLDLYFQPPPVSAQSNPAITAVTLDFYNSGANKLSSFLGDPEPYKWWPPYDGQDYWLGLQNLCTSATSATCKKRGTYRVKIDKNNVAFDPNDEVYLTSSLQKCVGNCGPVQPHADFNCNLQDVNDGSPVPLKICDSNNNTWLWKIDKNLFNGDTTFWLDKYFEDQQGTFVPAGNGVENVWSLSGFNVWILRKTTGECNVATCNLISKKDASSAPLFKVKYWPIINWTGYPAQGYCTDFSSSPAPTWTWNYEQGLNVPYPATRYRVALMAKANLYTRSGGAWVLGGLVYINYPGSFKEGSDPKPGIALYTQNGNSFTLPQTVEGAALKTTGQDLPNYERTRPGVVDGDVAYESLGEYAIEVEENWGASAPPGAPSYPSSHPIRKIADNAGNMGPVWVNSPTTVYVKNGCSKRPSALITYLSNPAYQDPDIQNPADSRYLDTPNGTPSPVPEKTNVPAAIVWGKEYFYDDQTTNNPEQDKRCIFNGVQYPATGFLFWGNNPFDIRKPIFKFIYTMRSSDQSYGFKSNGVAITNYTVQLQKSGDGLNWVNEGSSASVPYDSSGSKFLKNCWFPSSYLDRSQWYRLKVQAQSSIASLRSDIIYRELPPGGIRPSVLNGPPFTYPTPGNLPVELPADSKPAVQIATGAGQVDEGGFAKPSTCGGNAASADQPVWSWYTATRTAGYEYGFKANGTNIALDHYYYVLQKSTDGGINWTDQDTGTTNGTCYRPNSVLTNQQTTNYRLKVTAYDTQANGGNPSDTVIRNIPVPLWPPTISVIYFNNSVCSAYTVDPFYKTWLGQLMWGMGMVQPLKLTWQWGYIIPGNPSDYRQFIIKTQKQGSAPVDTYTYNPNSNPSVSRYNNSYQLSYNSGVAQLMLVLNSNSGGILKFLLGHNPSLGNTNDINGLYDIKVQSQSVSDPTQVSAERLSTAKVDLDPPTVLVGVAQDNGSNNPKMPLGWRDGPAVPQSWQAGVSTDAGGYNMPAVVTSPAAYGSTQYVALLSNKVQDPASPAWPVDYNSSPAFNWLATGNHNIQVTIADQACYDAGGGALGRNTTSQTFSLNRSGNNSTVVRPMTRNEYDTFVNWRKTQCDAGVLGIKWSASQCQTDQSYLSARHNTCVASAPDDTAYNGQGGSGLDPGAFVFTRDPAVLPRVPAPGNYSACDYLATNSDPKAEVKTSENSPVFGFVVVDQGEIGCNASALCPIGPTYNCTPAQQAAGCFCSVVGAGGTNAFCPVHPGGAPGPWQCTQGQQQAGCRCDAPIYTGAYRCPVGPSYICDAAQQAAGCYCKSLAGAGAQMCPNGYVMNAPQGIDITKTSVEMALNGSWSSPDSSLYLSQAGNFERTFNKLLTNSYPPAVQCAQGNAPVGYYKYCNVLLRLPDSIWNDQTGIGDNFPYFEPSLDPNLEWRDVCLASIGPPCLGSGTYPNFAPGMHYDRPDTHPAFIWATYKTKSSVISLPKYSSESTSPYKYNAWYRDNSPIGVGDAYYLRVNAYDKNNGNMNQVIKFRVNQNEPEVP